MTILFVWSKKKSTGTAFLNKACRGSHAPAFCKCSEQQKDYDAYRVIVLYSYSVKGFIVGISTE